MALPEPTYILLKNFLYMEVSGALSVTHDEAGNIIEVYDLTVYRNIMDAGSIGREWAAVVDSPYVSGQDPEGADDRLLNVPPFPMLKQRTMFKWWSGAAGTGDVLAECWADQFVGYSKGIPKLAL